MSRIAAEQWLRQQGVTVSTWLHEVLGGFDFAKPVYEQHLAAGDLIYQYIRNPSLGQLNPARGNWFCLAGAGTGDVAISDGLSGRRLHKFRVELPAIALEGTAAALNLDFGSAVGGPGGATQLFVPPKQIARIRPVGAAERAR